jgi:hypothetical protein
MTKTKAHGRARPRPAHYCFSAACTSAAMRLSQARSLRLLYNMLNITHHTHSVQHVEHHITHHTHSVQNCSALLTQHASMPDTTASVVVLASAIGKTCVLATHQKACLQHIRSVMDLQAVCQRLDFWQIQQRPKVSKYRTSLIAYRS